VQDLDAAYKPMTSGNTSFLTGTLEMIVLQLLQAEPTNGYDLTLRIQAISNEVLNVNAGSLYPALYRLEHRGLLKTWEKSETGRKTKVYSLTATAREQLVSQRAEWARFSGALAAILE
jgi:PadR family transcriptional regulator, regulatory protein PadR